MTAREKIAIQVWFDEQLEFAKRGYSGHMEAVVLNNAEGYRRDTLSHMKDAIVADFSEQALREIRARFARLLRNEFDD